MSRSVPAAPTASRSSSTSASTVSTQLVRISRRLSRELGALSFGAPVACVYNPLDYARLPHERYLVRARRGIDALFLGMNPGPFGMAQTGVPFGEVDAVRGFLAIEAPVARPACEHPRRPVDGFACRRSEVSGRRFWGLVAREFGTSEAFFERGFVWNWCPLAFLAESGANLTPDRLPRDATVELERACDAALVRVVRALEPRLVIGVGGFASRAATRALGDAGPEIRTILHPSPASPAANRGWDAPARAALRASGFLRR